MPKLNKAMQTKVTKAEAISFEPIPAGIYPITLMAVDGTKSGPKGPYWSWEFKVSAGDHTGRKLWINTTLAEGSEWGLKAVYESLGFTLDSDTDEMCGSSCRGLVSVGTINTGPRKGEKNNNLDRVMPDNGDTADDDGFGGDTGAADDDGFGDEAL